MGLRDLILKSEDIKLNKIHVKEWGCDIYIKQICPREQNEYFQWCDEERKKYGELSIGRVNSKYVTMLVCDENGKRVFSDDDFDKIMEKNACVINYIAEKINDINTFTTAEVEDIAKKC